MKNKIDIFQARKIALEHLSDHYKNKHTKFEGGIIAIHEETAEANILQCSLQYIKNKRPDRFYFDYIYHHGSLDVRPA